MTNHDPLEYLTHLKSKGINLDLGPVTRLLRRLGNPHKNYRAVLIGGTNGKGSVAAMLSSILTRGGFTVGLYTSPHFIDFRERIRINNRMIEQEDLSQLIDQVRNVITEDVTYFEFATAVAFLHFSRCQVDLAVVEVGMGGRLDATNVVDSEVSVIT
ncbi:MAG: bifunctional folylpolyglutamate synthase/dihydrofolate synthase, partial [Deltaproteobacteria bacterium]|nr:bifunctional folylpolyglutamate synthase/dihydrofolate synthase [Deltaproteobacteria bacterium]